jgi:hypothetical protein
MGRAYLAAITRLVGRAMAGVALVASCSVPVAAQSPAQPASSAPSARGAAAAPSTRPPAFAPPGQAAGTVDADPLRCWWRSSTSAVRVAETFSVVLTCAVVETNAVTVVPNEAELDPHSMQLPPFDVVGGEHGSDLRSGDRRFFQYEYRLRFVGDDSFGKDVKLPELKLSYKVRSRVDGDALEGRDQTYVLPATSIRVLSLVPADATDIRDATLETFGDIDRRTTRANVLRAIGGVLFAFAALAALLAVLRLFGGTRRRAPGTRALVSDLAILRGIGRELAAIDRARREGRWTPPLAARVLTALRLLSAYALRLPAMPRPAAASSTLPDQLTLRGRGLRGTRIAIPSWVTAPLVAEGRAGERSAARGVMLEQLEDALARLTAAQYGRQAPLDEPSLDAALALGVSVLRPLTIDNLGVVKKIRAWAR